MKLVKRLKSLKLNTELIGLDMRSTTRRDWCTPVGAKIIGWEGCGGIHYCFIRGFGEMVFSVNPMLIGEHHAYPLAKDFKDFLRLILATGSTAALEQIICWEKEAFEEFINSEEERIHFLSPKVSKVLRAISEEFQISPMEDSYEYVKDVQKNFDPSMVTFSKKYYDTLSGGASEKFEWTTVIMQEKR